jgi:adenylate kinase
MKLVLIGPPGCGKGTQAELLKKKFDIPHVSSGNILREAVKAGTALGKKIKKYMDKGEIGPQELIADAVIRHIEDKCPSGFILDGFPRTLYQAEKLNEKHNVVAAIYLKVADKEIVKRITGRRTCEKCGLISHVDYSPPRKADTCDACKGPLFKRTDDNAETVKNRIKVYNEETVPVLDFYKKTGVLREINANVAPDLIFKEILNIV